MTIVVVPGVSSTGVGGRTYLQLAQLLRRKCRISGTGPTGLTGQSEEYNRVLDWVNEAYMLIQRMRTDWLFLRASAACTTVQGQAIYSPLVDFALTDFGYWALDYESGDTFRNYVTAVGTNSEVFMSVMGYDEWRDSYQFGAVRQSFSRPMVVALTPNYSIACGPIPAAGYTIAGDYYKVPTELLDAGDFPLIPAQFQMAIVYRAMMLYGASQAASEIYDDGAQNFDVIVRQMTATYGPRMTLAGSLC